MTIKELQPKIVWNNFHLLTQQPRPSKHEEKVRAFLLAWGKEHGIETITDETGNVIMRVPATPGYENRVGVILQGHMDMVPQKTLKSTHDFENDPIETWIDGEWVRAKDTTLGADDGLGVALGMAVAESTDVPHGPVEVLVTYDEETGMTGAKKLTPKLLKGDILINLDSETEGEIYIGCAGGLDASASAKYERKAEPERYECYTLAVKDCRGGHSGLEINECRANANKVIARVLYALLTEADVKLIDLEGGTLRNAIPRDAEATLYVKDVEKAAQIVKKVEACVLKEHEATDPKMHIDFTPYKCAEGETCNCEDCKYVEEKSALKFVQAILACPDGVDRMSDSLPGLVETSNNLAIVRICKGEFKLHCLMRSSVDSGKEFLALKLKSVFDLAGIDVEFSGGYSGWAPNPKSSILNTMKEVYKKINGEDPKVVAVHAGLECAIMADAYPNWDMVSIGPTLLSPHSPDERAFIPSVQKSWDFLKEVLASIPEK